MCIFISQLETVNKNLEAYYDAWDKFVKAWIVIQIKDPSCVYEWRLQVGFCGLSVLKVLFVINKRNKCLFARNLQAEIAMREAGNPGMSDDEVCTLYILVSYLLSAEPETYVFWGIYISGKRFCFTVLASLQCLPPHSLFRRTKRV